MAVRFTPHDLVSFTNGYQTNLGEGRFSKVYSGNIPEDNAYSLPAQQVAVKVARQLRPQDFHQFPNELNILQQLPRHPNIINLVGWCQTATSFSLVLELASGGMLTDKIDGLNWKDTLKILRGIANALLYLHSTDFVIGDLKSPNILLDENHEPKLCDFGTAGRTGLKLNASTPGYMDPSEEYTGLLETSYDIYSFGVMLLQIVMKKNDVLGPNMKHIKDLAREAVDAQKHVVSVKLKASGCQSKDRRSLTKLGVQMTELCPLSRPTINEVFSILESMKVKKVKSTFYEASQKLKKTMKI